MILRRQVPIRQGEEPRSWLGGLPRMPKGVEWPRARDGRPYHFIAQVACADLPGKPWGVFGPRRGWLLFFVDAKGLTDGDEGRDYFHALHVKTLGPERQPPADMPRLRHMMSDYLEGDLALGDDVTPKLWRRWPVDLVPGVTPTEGVRLGEALYGQSVDSTWASNTLRDLHKPLTRRGALYLVEGLARRMAHGPFRKEFELSGLVGAPRAGKSWMPGPAAKAPAAPGWLEQDFSKVRGQVTIETGKLVAHDAELAEALAKPEAEQDARRISHLHYLIGLVRDTYLAKNQTALDFLTPFMRPGGEEALAAHFTKVFTDHMDWAARQHALLLRWRSDLMADDPDAQLDDATWDRLMADLDGEPTESWDRMDPAPCYIHKTATLRSYATKYLNLALYEDVLDVYTSSAAGRDRIPRFLLGLLEPKFRDVGEVPHQLGGKPMAVQGSGLPRGTVLLFQVGSDPSLGWMWGDLGGIYFCIRPWNLILRRFHKVYGWLEAH